MSLVCWLPLDGDLRNLGTSDVEFINNNVTFNTSGKIGPCAEFNGSNSYLLSNNFEIGNIWSYGMWVYSATSSRVWEGVLILNNDGGDSDMQLGMYTYPGGNRIQNTANGQYNSGISYTYGQWNHFMGTFDGTNLKTYLNGTLINTKNITASLLLKTHLTIGARHRSSTYDCYFQGKINDVRIYDHCLSPMEVYSISKAKILHYQFDNDISDCAGYGHDGTISAYTTSADTPRYLLSTVLTGSQSGSTPYLFDSTALIPEFTWAGWIYRDYTDATTRYLYQGIVEIYLHTDFTTRMRWNHGKSDGTYSGSTWSARQTIPYQQWTHLAWTFKDGYLKIYINGEYKKHFGRTSTGQYIKGYRNNLLANNWIGKISDMRIYATALSDDDIKFLYECKGAVDNGNSVWSYNFYETSSNTKTDVITYSTTDLNLNTTTTLSSSPYDKYSNAITINRNASYYTISLSSRIKTQSGSGSCNIYIVYYDSSGSELSLTQIASSSLTTTARTVAINRAIVIKDMPTEATTFKIRLMGSRPINYTAFSGSIVESITNYCVDNKGNFYSNIITVDSSLTNSYIGADRNLHAVNLIEL